ncbi:hypothetical protein AVEN_243852-1 [Araneus ventricosus]|uniref:Uncharacterized protein n=1 Tax=Araneus ventricosus TaxID=182803 RepID=A0A4Y2A6S6_ARAVE|nr:hypothetical protein AVEN_243852-1 [Araneus ventricosus]
MSPVLRALGRQNSSTFISPYNTEYYKCGRKKHYVQSVTCSCYATTGSKAILLNQIHVEFILQLSNFVKSSTTEIKVTDLIEYRSNTLLKKGIRSWNSGAHFSVKSNLLRLLAKLIWFLRDHMVPCSKPNPPKDPSCMWDWCTLNRASRVKHLSASGMWKFEEGLSAQVSPTVRNYEVRPKLGIVLLQIWTLIELN